MEILTTVIKALSDPSRLKILALLQHSSLCVCEIESLLPLSQPAISIHLKVLSNAKLIKSEKQGSWMIYHIISDQLSDPLKQIVKSILDYLKSNSEIKLLREKQKVLNLRPKCNK